MSESAAKRQEFATIVLDPPWRVRDRFARLLGFHCWDCMVAK